jgi:squalene synthase HpnC
VSVDHYENFPVASWLCPAPLRPAVIAIYRFARTADDIADEGDAPPQARLEALQSMRRALRGSAPDAQRWPRVFDALEGAIEHHGLPRTPFVDLLDAFEQDVHNPVYADRDALLAYCRRSANPVGRLLLHLYGLRDAVSLTRSDDICTALQLINFWQDLGRDLAQGRCYVPQSDAQRHGIGSGELHPGRATPASRALVRELCAWAGQLMQRGAPLVRDVPGRAGWELRLVVQGGLRILEKIERIDHATLEQRPTIGPADALPMAWRALRMSGLA